jgi:hypothetical protein
MHTYAQHLRNAEHSRFALQLEAQICGRRRKKIMDTVTYAAAAVLPESVANSTARVPVPEVEVNPLDLSYFGRSI